MQTRKKPTRSTRASSREASGDYSIYLPRDRVKAHALPFRIADYDEKGIFSEDVQKAIVQRHGLDAGHVAELSILVGNALDVESYVSFVRISRSRVERRIETARRGGRLRTQPMYGEDDIGLINQAFAALTLPFFVPVEGEPPEQIHMAGSPEAIWGAGDRDLGISGARIPIKLDLALKVLVPDDHRAEADDRRRAVVEQCCHIAREAGWAPSYTTRVDRETVTRTGRLFDFIQDVVWRVTEPQNILSGHTLLADLDVVLKRIEVTDETSAPT